MNWNLDSSISMTINQIEKSFKNIVLNSIFICRAILPISLSVPLYKIQLSKTKFMSA